MNKILKINTLIGFVFVTSLLFGQTARLKKADAKYANLSYLLAASDYERLIGTEVDNSEMKVKLANCYYQIGNMKKAEEYYTLAFSSTKDLSLVHYFYFAQTLKQNGKYVESDKWMTLFHAKETKDLRGVLFSNDQSYLSKILGDQAHFTIENVSFNSPKCDFGGYNFSKGKTLYFMSSRRKRIIKRTWTWNADNFLDIYTRKLILENEVIKPFSKKVNSSLHEGPICFSLDETNVYFTRNNIVKGIKGNDQKGIHNLTLNMAKVDENGNWSNSVELKINSKEYSVGHPTISKDGKMLYFVSDIPGGFGGADIYKAEILPDGNLGKPMNLGNKINTEGQEMFPWVTKDGQLFFASDGLIGLGGLDIFVAALSKEGLVNAFQHAGIGINSERDDFAFILNGDGKTGYFSSNRDGGQGDDDIYSFSMIKPFLFSVTLTGTVTAANTKTILLGSKVTLLNSRGETIESVIVDEKGMYNFTIEPEKSYSVVFNSSKFDEITFTADAKNATSGVLVQNAQLNLKPDFGFLCLVTDSKSNNPLENTHIIIKDKMTGEVLIDQLTSNTGEIQKVLENNKIGDNLNYEITIEKEGYLLKTLLFNFKIDQAGIINIHEKLNLSLSKLDVGMDLATMIDIKPIYFDIGKFVIRKDASLELDKIVKVMNDYPLMQVELGSHTDCRSSYTSNEILSANRANASASYIKSRIKDPERIYGKGYGESKLKIDCPCEGKVKSSCTELEHQQNRRTEFVIIKM
jgi:outer membrane protein OmpA-like peptidoglycan-associated protein